MSGGQAIHPSASVDERAELGEGVTVGALAVVQAGVVLGAGCEIGPSAVLLTGSSLGRGCVVEPGAVIGKRPRLRPGSSARTGGEELSALMIGDEVVVCAGAVVYAGAHVAARAIIGDQAQVRERAHVGEGSVLGRGSCLDYEGRMGQRVSVQSGVYLTAGTVVEDDVFVGPGVVTTNDNTMGRHPRGEGLAGPRLCRGCRLGGGAVLAPGVLVGEEAFIAAGAVVVCDVEPRAVMMGVPARGVREVPEGDLLHHWR